MTNRDAGKTQASAGRPIVIVAPYRGFPMTGQAPKLAEIAQRSLARSRRFSSRSTATLMKSARPSSSFNTVSIRPSVPSGNLAGVCSWFICFLPMPKYT